MQVIKAVEEKVFMVTWKKLVEDPPPPLTDKSLSFSRPTSQILAFRKKEVQVERSGPKKNLILQGPSTADLLLQDPLYL